MVDGIGHSDGTHAIVPVLATAAARVAAHRGVLPGLMTAAEILADPGEDGDAGDAVAVVALAVPDDRTMVAWCGDARAYGWDGTALTQYTTDATMGHQLREHGGVPADICEHHDAWVRTSLVRATIATVREVTIPAGHWVILTTDGVHDRLTPEEMTNALRGADGPRAASTALTAAATSHSGPRDDAAAVVIG
ncbi:hypothetical protein [Streptomyces malaysiensis]